jgi:hypothetical protein
MSRQVVCIVPLASYSGLVEWVTLTRKLSVGQMDRQVRLSCIFCLSNKVGRVLVQGVMTGGHSAVRRYRVVVLVMFASISGLICSWLGPFSMLIQVNNRSMKMKFNTIFLDQQSFY